MDALIKKIKKLECGRIGAIIREKIRNFKKLREDKEAVFSELCFCLLTANSSAETGIKVQNAIGSGFGTLTEKKLIKKLRELGYRFYNVRAKYIIEARKQKENIWAMLKECENEFELRDWLVDNIKGLGYKEASHFLRNRGYENLAILDRHILRTLYEQKFIDSVPKTLNQKKYFEYERELEKICNILKLTQAELDLYLWYLKTGKVLK